MYSVFVIRKPANHPQIVEHVGDFVGINAARVRARDVLLDRGDASARAEIDSKGRTVEVVRAAPL